MTPRQAEANRNAFSRKSFLALLAERVRTGLSGLPAEVLTMHAAFVTSCEKEPGGYAGRKGDADVYYTGFAARALHALDRLDDSAGERLTAFLKRREPADIIEALTIANTLMLAGRTAINTEKLFSFLERFRTPDGGYARRINGRDGSTYHSFLAALCYNLCEQRPPEEGKLKSFVALRRCGDGGFCDAGDSTRSNTNATAAGVSLALMLDAYDASLIKEVSDCLTGMHTKSGGWLAGPRVPFADLLSTSTALIALNAIGAVNAGTVNRALDFARQCEERQGGFKAGPWDSEADVEYTFYGLTVYALAAGQNS